MAPALIVLALLSIFPFLYIVALSFSRVGLLGGISLEWAAFDNWTRLFTDGAVGASWLRSVVYFVATVGLEMVLGVGIALLLHEIVRGRNVLLSALLMPMFMAPVIVGLLGRFLTDSTYGLYAWVLRETGIYTGEILGGTTAAFVAVTLMDVWQWTPLITLIVLAGLVYDKAFWGLEMGYAAAIGLSMLAVSILLANVFMGQLKRRGLAK